MSETKRGIAAAVLLSAMIAGGAAFQVAQPAHQKCGCMQVPEGGLSGEGPEAPKLGARTS